MSGAYVYHGAIATSITLTGSEIDDHDNTSVVVHHVNMRTHARCC